MVIIYDSLTGQAKKFAQKFNLSAYDINHYDDDLVEDVLLVTRTFNFGEIPKPTKLFLEKNSHLVKGVCVSGNRNWGANYGAAGDKISQMYNIPLILKFEASGFDKDVNVVKHWLENQQKEKGEQNYVNV